MSTKFTPASSKPDKLLTGFISVRAPELKHIYNAIQGPTSVSELTKKFGKPTSGGVETDHVEETVRFLNAVDLVESPSGDIRDTVERINERHLVGLPFEARLLYHCNQQGGRQTHFAAVYRALLNEGSRTVNGDRDNLRTILKRETDYDFSWTDEKIDMWVTLSEQLGLIIESEDDITLSPCRALMHDALVLAPMSSDGNPNYDDVTTKNGEFRRALDWINDNLFSVYEERAGTPRVHPAIADVLRNMEDDGVISLSSPGDSQNAVKIPPENLNEDVRGNRRDVTRISIQSHPDETAYQYPLTQFLTQQ
ncbi:hypothetical protein [Haloferax marisrubri]|uniref:Uncharacterized protein n=1 Tax=Haloferax marisrubri TaxID=1544719 RepID=A0A2P4NPH0_9EURY|nr:hypothetical protein [Haloferax marisrubri]POG55047.1 hypothetical protein AUR65_011495 [Haloferax marisrubri]